MTPRSRVLRENTVRKLLDAEGLKYNHVTAGLSPEGDSRVTVAVLPRDTGAVPYERTLSKLPWAELHVGCKLTSEYLLINITSLLASPTPRRASTVVALDNMPGELDRIAIHRVQPGDIIQLPLADSGEWANRRMVETVYPGPDGGWIVVWVAEPTKLGKSTWLAPEQLAYGVRHIASWPPLGLDLVDQFHALDPRAEG